MVSMGISMTINFVVVAPLARKAGFSAIEIAIILTCSSVLYASLTPLWGRLAQRIGTRLVMAFSLAAMAFTNLVFLLALKAALDGVIVGISGFLILVFARMSFGLLSPGLQPAAMSAMADATLPAERAAGLGMLGAAMNVGSLLGPAGAALLARQGALLPIWGAILFSCLCSMMVFLLLPRMPQRAEGSAMPPRLKMSDPRIRPHFLFMLAYFIAIGIVQQTISWFIQDRYHFTDTVERTAAQASVSATGMVFMFVAATSILTQFGIVTRFRPDPRKALPLGLALMAAGYAIAVLFHPFAVLCFAYAMIGTGGSLAMSSANALGTLSVPREAQGAAAALLATAPPAGFVFGPLIGAGLYQASHLLPFTLAGLMMASLCVYAIFVARRSAAGLTGG